MLRVDGGPLPAAALLAVLEQKVTEGATAADLLRLLRVVCVFGVDPSVGHVVSLPSRAHG